MKDFDIKTDPWPLVSDRLQCRTPASKTSGLAPVLLKVEDRYAAEYKIYGTSAGHQFHYKVQLIHVHFHFSFFLKDFLKVCLYFIFFNIVLSGSNCGRNIPTPGTNVWGYRIIDQGKEPGHWFRSGRVCWSNRMQCSEVVLYSYTDFQGYDWL